MMDAGTKDILGVLATVIACGADIVYIGSIFRGRTRPHAFAWILWDLILIVVFLGQMKSGAHAGSWLAGYNAVVCSAICGLAWKRGERATTRNDRIVMMLALLGIPLWVATRTPLWSLCLETAISTAPYWVTIKKALRDPYSESATAYFMFAIPWGLSILAMTEYSISTLVFPVYAACCHTGFVILLLWRRRALRASQL